MHGGDSEAKSEAHREGDGSISRDKLILSSTVAETTTSIARTRTDLGLFHNRIGGVVKQERKRRVRSNKQGRWLVGWFV